MPKVVVLKELSGGPCGVCTEIVAWTEGEWCYIGRRARISENEPWVYPQHDQVVFPKSLLPKLRELE